MKHILWYLMFTAGTALAGGLEQRVIHETIEPGGLELGPKGVKVTGFDWTDYTTIIIITGAVILMFLAYGFVKWGPAWINTWRNRKNGTPPISDIKVKTNGEFKLNDKITEILERLTAAEEKSRVNHEEVIANRVAISESERRVIHEIDELKDNHRSQERTNEKINTSLVTIHETFIGFKARVDTVIELLTTGKLKRADDKTATGG